VDLTHPLGRVARQLAWVAEGDIGVAGRMHRLSPRVVVESAEAILVLVVVTAIAIGSETVIVTAMEDGLGMRGIGVHRFLGENRRLHEHRGVTGIGHLRIDGRHPASVSVSVSFATTAEAEVDERLWKMLFLLADELDCELNSYYASRSWTSCISSPKICF